MNFADLTPEQQEMARGCKSAEELLALAKEQGLELSDDDIAAVSGGGNWDSEVCPDCKLYCSMFVY